MDAAFKIRLLNGALAGRTLNLPIGTLTIGADEADLALPLEQGRMATLTVETEGVMLQDGTPCWVDGQVQLSGVLPLGHFIDLAGLHFVLGGLDAELATLPEVSRAPSRGLRFGWILAGGITVLALIGGMAWWLMPVPEKPPITKAWLPTALRPFPGLHAAWQADGSLRVTGRCSNSDEVAELQARLDRTDVRYQWLVQCDDELLRNVQALMRSYGYDRVTVSLTPEGQVDIQGSVRNDKRFAELIDALDRLPGLAAWEIVDQPGKEFSQLLASLRAANQLDGLSVQQGQRSWIVSGALTVERVAQLRALLDGLTQSSAISMPVRFISADSEAAARDYLPADIAGIDGNRVNPYLMLTNGMRLLAGSKVRNDMRIVAIYPDGVSLAGRNALVFLPVRV